MTRYTIYQPAADDPGDLTNAVLALYTGVPASVCGLAPASEWRAGMLNWQEDALTIPTVNLLLNTVFAGAVSGTPGTTPTAWLYSTTGGALTVSGETIRIVATTTRDNFRQSRSVLANTSYFWSIVANVTTSGQLLQHIQILSPPAGATKVFSIDGVTVSETTVLTAGIRTIGVRLNVAATAGSALFYWGNGISSNLTCNITFSQPQMQVGTARTAYQPITATS